VRGTRGEQIKAYLTRIDGCLDQIVVDWCKVPDSVRLQAKMDAVTHHAAHFHNLPIKETSVCPYKIASWYGFALSRHATLIGADLEKIILLATIDCMNAFLKEDCGKMLPGETAALLWHMAKNHDMTHLEDYAIGRNGLYVAFFAAKKIR
jgi:hypothetical protein